MGSFNGGAQLRRLGRAANAPIAVAPDRTKLMRAIHAACRKAGLDEDGRRDVQVGVTGKASMGDMDAAELAAVLARLNRGASAADRPHVGKVRALWWSLHWLGAVDQADARAIDVFVQRQTGVAALRFLDHRQAHRVVEALKSWCAREGVVWPVPPSLLGDRRAVLGAIERHLRELGGERGVHLLPGLPTGDPATWSAAELDAAIRAQGKRLRKALGKP